MRNIVKRSRFTGYKGIDRIGREAKQNLNKMETTMFDKDIKVDLTTELNNVLIEAKYNLYDFMNQLGYINETNDVIIKRVSDEVKLVAQDYITLQRDSDMTNIANIYSRAIAFYSPSAKELHVSFTAESIKKIEKIKILFQIQEIDLKTLILNIVYHEILHCYFDITGITNNINASPVLFYIFQDILNYNKNLTTPLRNIKETFVKYKQTQPTSYLEELVTWYFTMPEVLDNILAVINKRGIFLAHLYKLDVLQEPINEEKEMEKTLSTDEYSLNVDFFETNPTKVLGTKDTRNNQYGKEQEYIIGDINTEIDKIDASLPEINYHNSDQITNQNTDNINIEKNINKSIENIENSIVKNTLRQKNKEKSQKHEKRIEEINKQNQIISFRDSVSMYNKSISRKELEAYLISNKDIDFNLFIDNFEYTETDLLDSGTTLFVQSGDGSSITIDCKLLYFLDSKLQYFATFLTGNVYEKINKTIEQAEEIKQKLGDMYFEKQIEDLKAITPKGKKITAENIEERPTILPYTAFCLEYVIKELKTGETLSLPIISVFLWWCRSSYYSSVKYNGATYNDIENYVNNANFVTASKDATKEEKQRIDEKNSELYQFAKTNGDTAFSDFLATFLVDDDVNAIEKYFNERFNNYVYPNLSKIPVGFTHNKYFKKGSELIFSETQRNSVAFMNINGSGLLGYDVGVGKTLSAIINLSNSIDMGKCLRALLIVPNPTYYKWIAEIQNTEVLNQEKGLNEIILGALPHINKINGFYNMNNELIVNELKTYTDEEYAKMDSIKQANAELKSLLKEYEIKNEDSYNKFALTTEKVRNLFNEKVFPTCKNITLEFLTELGYARLEDVFNQSIDVKETNEYKKYLDSLNLTLKRFIAYHEYILTSLIVSSGEWNEIPEKSITICTYEGFKRMGFSKATQQEMQDDLINILSQGQNFYKEIRGQKILDEKKVAKFQQKIQKAIGQSIRDSKVEIDTLGFDYVVIDEAHACKKVFTLVESSAKEDKYDFEKKGRYKLQSGEASVIALKAFCLTHFIQKNKNGANVCLLTATPFTNSPLEIYSMLSLTNHNLIKKNGFEGLQEFFDYYIKTEYKMVFNTKNQPVKKEEVVGFNNLYSMRALIYSVIDYKTGDEIKIQRPCKISLPIKDTSIICQDTAQEVELPIIETIITPTDQQKKFLLQIENYISGTKDGASTDMLELGNIEIVADGDVAEEQVIIEEERQEPEVKEIEHCVNCGGNDEPDFVRIMKGLNFMRAVTLSPYMFKPANLGKPSPKELVETSPKIKYVLSCISELNKYRQKNNLDLQGIVIYCNLGTNEKSFGFNVLEMLKKYMESSDYQTPYKEGEVELLYGKTPKGKREKIKKDFNEGRVKVLIGSASIKEGIDLQSKTIGLFNLTVDWNPTDAKQIEGRCWRQGNENAYVFINYVLVADSADIVYFQKLQDKTQRIKEIWDKSGVKSQLDLKDFDPNRMKLDLLTRPDKIAKIEMDLETEKYQRESKILFAQIEELRNAKKEISLFNEAKPQVIQGLIELQDVIVEYRRKERIATKDEKVRKLKLEYSEIDFNDDLTQEEKIKEKEKLMSEIKKVSGDEFIQETNEMYKAEKDYTNMSMEDLSKEVKAVADRFLYNGTYYKYMYDNNLRELDKYYSLFNLSKQTPAYYFRNYWKRAEFYEQTYLRANNLTIEQIDTRIEQIVELYSSIEDNIKKIYEDLPLRIESIKDRIRRKESLYKNIDGRVDEFKSIFHLTKFQSAFGLAIENKLIEKPIEIKNPELEAEKQKEIEIEERDNKQQATTSKKEFIEKKIRVFESLAKMSKDKNKKAFLEKKIRVFNTLAKGYKMACGGVVKYEGGGNIETIDFAKNILWQHLFDVAKDIKKIDKNTYEVYLLDTADIDDLKEKLLFFEKGKIEIINGVFIEKPFEYIDFRDGKAIIKSNIEQVEQHSDNSEIKVFSVGQQVEYKGEPYNIVKLDKLVHISQLTPNEWDESLTENDLSFLPEIAEKELK
jgi:hypothetical protein